MDKQALDQLADHYISPADIARALELPPDYFRTEPLPDLWTLGPVIRHRDSGLVDQSNAASLIALLQSDPSLNGQWRVESASHWAVGSVEHLTHLVCQPNGDPSRVHQIITGFYKYLRDEYPVWDDYDYSERECRASEENLTRELDYQCRKHGVKSDDALYGEVVEWLQNNRPESLESHDDFGSAPSGEIILEALRGLGKVAQ